MGQIEGVWKGRWRGKSTVVTGTSRNSNGAGAEWKEGVVNGVDGGDASEGYREHRGLGQVELQNIARLEGTSRNSHGAGAEWKEGAVNRVDED